MSGVDINRHDQLAAGVGWVTAGAMTANVASSLLHIPASRWLGTAKYGEFASLLAVQLILVIPAFAVQAIVARELVRGGSWTHLRGLAIRIAVSVAVVGVLAIPLLSVFLHTSMAAVGATVVIAPLLVLLSAVQGLLQGRTRFRRLALVLAVGGLARVVPMIIAVGLGFGIVVALWSAAIGTALCTAIVWLTSDREPEVSTAETVGMWAVLQASQAQSAVLALSSIDLVLARHVLDAEANSLFALGAVVAKVALWLPNAIATVLYPATAHPESARKATRMMLGAVAAIGVVVTLATLIAAPLAPMIVGDGYRPIAGWLVVFAVQGACLAVVQAALLIAIAGDRTWISGFVWFGLACEAALVLVLRPGLHGLIAIACGVAVLSALAASVLVLGYTQHIALQDRRAPTGK